MDISSLVTPNSTSIVNPVSRQPGQTGSNGPRISHAYGQTVVSGILMQQHRLQGTNVWGVAFGSQFAKLTQASTDRLQQGPGQQLQAGSLVDVRIVERSNDPGKCDATFDVAGASLSLDTDAFEQQPYMRQYGNSFKTFIQQYQPSPFQQPVSTAAYTSYFVGDLPPELMTMVARSLPLEGNKNLRLLNQSNQSIANEFIKQHLQIGSANDLTPNGSLPATIIPIDKITLSGDWVTDNVVQQLVQNLPANSRITEIDLSGCRNISNASLRALQPLAAQLTHLNLAGCRKLTDAGIRQLQPFTLLQNLNLQYCNLTDAAFKHFKPLQNGTQPFSNLTHLDLSRCGRIKSTENLQFLTKLEHLNFAYCAKLANTGQLQHLPALKSLDLYMCRKLELAGFSGLRHLTGLTHLNVGQCLLSHAHYQTLQHLTNLQHLRLDGALLQDDIMLHISGMTRLTHLNLSSTGTSTTGLNHLQNMPNLRSLNLAYAAHVRQQPGGLPFLPHLTNLTSLKLAYCRHIVATDMQQLSQLPNLETLDLTGLTNLSDTELQQYVRPLQHLTTLKITNCETLTTASIQHLLNMPQLTTLDVIGCKFSAPDIRALKNTIQNVNDHY